MRKLRSSLQKKNYQYKGKDFTSHVSKLRMDMAKKRQKKQHNKIKRMVGVK